MSRSRSAEQDKQLLAKNGFVDGVDIKAGITGMITVFKYTGNDPDIQSQCVNGYIMVKIQTHGVAETPTGKIQAEQARLSYINECKILAALSGKSSSNNAVVKTFNDEQYGQYEFVINRPIFFNPSKFASKISKMEQKFKKLLGKCPKKIKEAEEGITECQTNLTQLESLKSVFSGIDVSQRGALSTVTKNLKALQNSEEDNELSVDQKNILSALGISDEQLGKYLIEILKREFDEDVDEIKAPELSLHGILRHFEALKVEAEDTISELEINLEHYRNPYAGHAEDKKGLLSESFMNLEQYMMELGANNGDLSKVFDVLFNNLQKQLSQLHQDGAIHGDLACRNAVITVNGKGENMTAEPVLIDFGLSRELDNNKAMIAKIDNDPIKFPMPPSYVYDQASATNQFNITTMTDDFAFRFMQLEAIALYCGLKESQISNLYLQGLSGPVEGSSDYKIIKNNDNKSRIENALKNLEVEIVKLRTSGSPEQKRRGELASAELDKHKAEILKLPEELLQQQKQKQEMTGVGMGGIMAKMGQTSYDPPKETSVLNNQDPSSASEKSRQTSSHENDNNLDANIPSRRN